MGSVRSALSEDRLERKGPLRPVPRGLGVVERRPCVRSSSEVRSPAPVFGPCPVIRPIARLARVFTLLGFRSPSGEGLAAAAYPPSEVCAPQKPEMLGLGGASPADLGHCPPWLLHPSGPALPAPSPQA